MGIKEIHFKSDRLTDLIIKGIINVHKTLGPGFLENIYRKSLVIELNNSNLKVETEKEVEIYYLEQLVGIHRLDILVEDKVILELKTVDALSKAHYAQLRSYLRATNKNIGFLVNFSGQIADFRRIDV